MNETNPDLADDSRQWLDSTPLAALECRTLRHQWPRMTRTAGRRAKHLPNDKHLQWKILGPVEAGRLLERHMTCLGGCGTTRIELFLVRHDGRMVRDGPPHYRYAATYLRKHTDHQPLEPLDHDDILGTLVHRLYPGLQW